MKTCVFCSIVAGKTAASIVLHDKGAVAFLDTSPVNPGHTVVVPTRHVRSFTDLSTSEVGEVTVVAQQTAALLKKKLGGCIGVSVSLADGDGAGQEVPHVHFHVIPRFPSDDFGWRRFGHRMERTRLDEIAAILQCPEVEKEPNQAVKPTAATGRGSP